MTTWENTDKIDNLTVTSDAAYERVTSDEHFEDERDWGFLKQNTSWLVQEIPNISFLDIADTMLESQKTLYNRKNWNIVVGKAWRSIEAQPQDLARLVSTDYQCDMDSEDFTVPFDDIEIPSGEDEVNIKTFAFENNGVKVLIPGVYRISYWWQLEPAGLMSINAWVWRNNEYITSDHYENLNGFRTMMSWWRSISVECKEGDVLTLRISWRWSGQPVVYLTGGTNSRFTYLEVQYIQQSLNNN